MAKPTKKAGKRWQKFTGRMPGEYTQSAVKTPTELICIAIPEFLTYYSKKLNGGGTGKLEAFKHRFGKSTKLYTNPEGTFVLITGPNLRVTSRGIVG